MNRIYNGVLVDEDGNLQWYENLQKEFNKRKIQHYEVAQFIDTDVNVLFDKIHGNGSFTTDEALMIQNRYCKDVPVEVLFKTSNVSNVNIRDISTT